MRQEEPADLAIVNARVVTPPGLGVRRGGAMRELMVLDGATVVVRGGRVERVATGEVGHGASRVIDAAGRVLLPGFVDCHTHACFAGSRLDEWERKLRGESYLEILKSGGGIMSTVRAVRGTGEEELRELTRGRLERMLALGSTTVEVKSGYGLSTKDELKMLRATRAAASGFAGTVVQTAMLGHAIDEAGGGREAFVERTIRETLPAVHAEFPEVAVDAFCESGAWTLEETTRLLRAAIELGHPVRVHADQFNSLGMVEAAIGLGARSVDHLEASTAETLRALANSPTTASHTPATVGTGLPCCGVHMTGRGGAGAMYADLRSLVDLGGACAIATNFNPGSSPCFSMAAAMGAAVRCCGLSCAEAITAATVNGAAVLGLRDRGAIVPGARADVVLLRCRDEREVCFEFGSDLVDVVVAGGRVVRGG
jgi:imidazolonepropionase